jgi:hypothetical protein
MSLEYRHVDVFSRRPFGGNSLPVFLDSRGLSTQQMLGTCIRGPPDHRRGGGAALRHGPYSTL